MQVVSLDANTVHLEEQIRLRITYQCVESDYRGEKTTIDLLALLPLLKSPYHRGNLTRRQDSVEIAKTLKLPASHIVRLLRTMIRSALSSAAIVESIVEESFEED